MTAPLDVLRRVAASRPAAAPGERCDMCAETLREQHSHVVDVRSRSMMCTCRPCYLLFTQDSAHLSYRAVPDRFLVFPDVSISAGQWDDLAIPVGVAFFLSHTSLGKVVAFYPSPAGATESELALGAWDGIAAGNPGLAVLCPDVEALLLRKQGDQITCYLVPVDTCYELVGHLRSRWRGFDGGADVHRRLGEFFADLDARAKPASALEQS